MEYPPHPPGEHCNSNHRFEWDGKRCMACWYPQMGGYAAKCVIVDCGTDAVSGEKEPGCFDAYVWHDGEFPFDEGDSRQPARVHHCMASQFVDFGEEVLRFQA